MKRFRDFFLGFLIGGTMSVPGVSGGTTAVALGCYRRILSATAKVRERGNFFYLLRTGLGGILGFFSVAGILNQCFRILPLTMTLLFCGAAGAGLYRLGKEALREGFSINGGLFFLLGLGAVVAVEKLETVGTATSPLLTVLFGILLAAGIILPGISTSHLLMVFGLYDDVTAVGGWGEIIALLPLAVGVGVGIFLLTKPLAAALERYPAYCNFALLGFGAGSLKALIAPCFDNPQISYLPWFQTVNGLILGAGAAWAILKLNARQNDGDTLQ